MMRTGRILLVEPEDDIRRDLDRQLDEAGHDVAAVPDESDAARLLEEGLDPDVVVLGGDDAASGTLRRLAPRAAHLRIDRTLARVRGLEETGEAPRCPPDPAEVLRRVEELLLRHHPPIGTDPGSRCLDLARRLANALPRARSVEERIALVTDVFDAFFGVRGTLVVRRRAARDGWIEATQAVPNAVVERIEKEIARRSRTRDIRPFLTRLGVDGAAHEVACVAIGLGGDEEIDLALVLERAPSQPGQREALMNLVGSAVRASVAAEELERARSLAEFHGSGLEALVEVTRELGAAGSAPELPPRLLGILRRELLVTRSVLFVRRDGGVERIAALGIPSDRLEDVRLPAAPAAGEVQPVAVLGAGAPPGERETLEALGLRWATAMPLGDDRTLLLLFGRAEEDGALDAWERRLLAAFLGAAAVAQRQLDRLDGPSEASRLRPIARPGAAA
jgi:DNA-binding response OmpR family regulator